MAFSLVRPWHVCLPTVFLAIIPAATSADVSTLSLEELTKIGVATVNGASKFDQKVTQAPSYVTIVTAEEIRLYGFRTLADLLESVPGIYINNDRNYSYLGVRGFGRFGDYNDHVLLMIDGHRLNDPIYGEALIGTEFPLDLDLVSRVEIIRGPGSALYGANAFFAVINVITWRGRDRKGLQVSAEAGTLGTEKLRAAYGQSRATGLDYLLSGSLYRSSGPNNLYFPELDTPATNNGISTTGNADRSAGLFGRLDYHDFSLQGLYESRTIDIPTGSYGTIFNDSRNRSTDAIGYFDLKYQHQNRRKWNFTARTAYDNNRYNGTYIYDDGVNLDLSLSDRLSAALDISRTFGKHRPTAGVETRFNIREDQANYDVDPYDLSLRDNRSSITPALFIQDEYSLRPNLLLSAGIRWDHYGTFGAAVNPRFGVIYNPLVRTTVKLLYGSAFRAPNDYELYYTSPASEPPQTSLRPETIRTTELVLEQYIARHFRFALAGFYNDIRALISERTDPLNGMLFYANQQNVRAAGADFEVAGRWRGGIQLRGSYSWQESHDRLTGNRLSDSPGGLAKLNFAAPLLPGILNGGLQASYRSRVRTDSGSQLDPFVFVNATLSSRETEHGWSISASVCNLLNTQYRNPVSPELPEDSILQNGRTLRLKVTHRLGSK